MAEILPDDIKRDLQSAVDLHQRATADYAKCEEFCKLLSDILSRLEDAGCYTAADKVMAILLDCSPKIGAHCDKSTIVGQAVKKLGEIATRTQDKL